MPPLSRRSEKIGWISFLYCDESLAKGKLSQPTVVPGDPAASEMLIRIPSDATAQARTPA